MRSNNRRRYDAYVIISLLVQIFEQLNRLPYKPPVTIFFLAANIIPFLFPIKIFTFHLWNIQQNCVQPQKIIQMISQGDYLGFINRIILSSLMHVDERHLYYNMLSFLVKGIQLEQSLGSLAFAQLICFSILAAHSIMVLLAYALASFYLLDDYNGYYSCAVGFSAVIFALKYVLYMRSSGQIRIYGFQINIKFAAWAELVLISLLNPNASFVGHLAGIMAGMLYHHGEGYVMVLFNGTSAPRFSSRGYAAAREPETSEERAPSASPEEMRRRRLQRYS